MRGPGVTALVLGVATVVFVLGSWALATWRRRPAPGNHLAAHDVEAP
jgi:hypothetical protein